MAKQTTEAIITMNGKQPLEVLEQIYKAASLIKTEMDKTAETLKNWQGPKDEPYKALENKLKALKGEYDILSSASVKNVEATERLQNAVANLANTSLKNLRKAIGDGKRQIEGLSEAEIEQANAIRQMMKIAGDQVRLLEGQYVKIREGLTTIGQQSDQWLSKAISQQQNLVSTIRRGTKEYNEQKQVLQMLTAEQDKRNAAISAEANAKRQAQFKQQVASSRQMLSSGNLGNYSQSEIQTSINTLKQAQSQTAMGGSEWKQYADEIKKAEAELDRLLGKTKEVKQQMSEGEAKSILGNVGGHTEQEVREAINALKLLQSTVNVGGSQWNAYAADIEKAETELGKLTGRIKETKAGLSMNDVNSRMQNLSAQSESSLKEMLDYLQKAKAELTPYSDEWEAVADQISVVKQRMADVAANAPYVRNEQSAQAIARNNQLNFGNGNTYDVTQKDLQWSKDYLQKQLASTPIADTAKIQQIQEALGLIDEKMKAISGSTEKATMSADKLDEVLNNMKTASLEELRDASSALKKKLDSLAPSSDEAKKIKKQLQDLDKEINQVQDDIVDVNDVISRSKNGKASITELKQAYKQLEEELVKINTGDKDFANKKKALEELRKKIDSVTASAGKQGGAWQTALKNLTAYVGLFRAFNAIQGLITSAIKKNLDYSASLTDIRKVSGLTIEDVNKLSTELAKIETRTSVDSLAQLAFQGAKLGMGKYGVDGMKQFVEAADKINVAIGEEMGEQALPALSKMVEVMGLIPKMGIGKAIEATGSAMFKLSSTSTATSNDITEFAKRCTGVARTAKITTPQLLALGSAFSSQMAAPEVAATAMSKFIVALQKNHNLIEKDLDIPQGTINKMYSAGNAMDAIVLILEKMKAKGNMNALGEIFKDVGGDGQRLVSSMVTMAKNVDMLKDHLYESEEAFEEATAVSAEYSMQQKSAIGILERANNLWEKAFVNPDGVEMVKNMAETWYQMSQTILQSPVFNGTLSASLWLVVKACQAFVYLLPLIFNYLLGIGVMKAGRFFVMIAKGIWSAVTAQAAFNTAASKNPYVILASVIATTVGVIWSFVNASQQAAEAEAEAAKKANAWKENLGKAAVETANLHRKLENYKKMMNEANLSQKARQDLISRFNKDFRSYISKLGIEIKSVKDLRDHYSELAQEAQRSTYYRMREQAKQQALPKLDAARNSASNNLMEKVKDLGIDKLGVSFKDIDRWVAKGANGNALFWYLVDKMPREKSGLVEGYKWHIDKNGFLSGQGDNGVRTGPKSKDRYIQSKLRDLLSATRWYANATNRRFNEEKKINKAFGNFVSEDYTDYTEDIPGTLEYDAEDKDAQKQAAKEKRDREKAWRDELKQKQDEANAIMDNVRNFYERQVNEKLSQAVSLGMDKTEQDLFVEPVKRRMNEALKQVRLAIAGQANTWEDFKKTMDSDLIEKTDETGVNLSQDLLNSIMSNNVDALHDFIMKLSKNLGLPDNAAIAQIFAKATKNEQANIKLEAQQAEARRKAAQENDYMGAVKQNMYDDFNTMGYANPTDVELADRAAFDKRKENIIEMYEKARKELSTLYTIDVSNESGRGLLMQFLFGDDPDGMGKRITSVLGNNAEDWKVFYNKLVQYSDNYTEAQKKTYDQQKKIADQIWAVNQRNLAQQERIRKMQNEANLFGKRTNLLSNLGLADLTADPEVELMKARMQAAEDYYEYVKANSRNQQLIDEVERARQEAELNYANQMATAMKSRLSQMKELVQPIEDFGAAVGQALADMKNDADSANEAIKNALKSMLESWAKMALNDVNTQMWKAINDAGAKRGRANAQPDIDAARANAKADAVKENLSDLGTASNPMYVHVVNGQPVDANGNPVAAPMTPTGDVVTNPDGTKGLPPTDNSNKGAYDPFANQNRSSVIFKDTAAQAGAAVADVATGNASLTDAGVGVIAAGANAALNAPVGGSGRSSDAKEKAKQLKEERKHQKELSKEVKKGSADREKENKKGVEGITKDSAEASKEQTKAEQVKQDTLGAIADTGLNTTFQKKQENDAAVVEQSKTTAEAENTFSIVGAIGKCFEFLGPIAGPIAAASVMAILTGLMQWGLNAAFGSKNKKNSSSTKNTKLVSGMLTYDSGNVQDLKPFVADNGEVYWAAENNAPKTGVNLLTKPTATTINGQPSLVAERGPELVIGRETTRAMMMDNPSLLKALVNYDRNYSGRNAARRAFNEGNVSESVGNLSSGASATDELISNATASNAALLQAVTALLQRLNEPISAKIDMYGRGNLYDSMTKANQFMKNK